MKVVLFITLGVFTLGFLAVWIGAIRHKVGRSYMPGWLLTAIGFVTNFFDTLGIGSFATTTSFYKLWGLVPDEKIPGTMNVGHTLPTITEALIFILVVQVDPTTLISMIAASVVGAWLGAGVVSRWPVRKVRIGMGSLLLCAAAMFTLKQLQLLPGGGNALGLGGAKLALAIGGNFVLGALMTLGIGLYAPCMVLVYLLGMTPLAAFPIMMGSCAFLMPVGSSRFVRCEGYDLKAALGLAIGGIPGVLLAAYVVKSLPLYWVMWLVVGVVLYTSAMMLRSAMTTRDDASDAVTAEA